jgi:transposase
MEATGHYWLSLYSFLVEKGHVIHVVNPILTDIIDSVLIAELIRYGNFLETCLADENIMSLRDLTRFRHYLVASIGDLKRKAICVLDQVFSEYQSVFFDVFGQTWKELLIQLQSPNDFQSITAEKLENMMKSITFKKFAQRKISTISELAENSFGLSFCRDSFSLQLKLLLEQIKFIDAQVSDVEAKIRRLLDQINSPITTITGNGPINGATILGEIGDISRFSTPDKLVAYVGISPSVSQSGIYQSANNKMSKRGSPYLRKALF